MGAASIIARLIVLSALAVATWFIVFIGRRYVESRRRAALQSTPPSLQGTSGPSSPGAHERVRVNESASVRILAFSSDDCAQCHRMQAPALARVRDARSGAVVVEDIDAPSAPDLTRHYHVLTVPTTVVLDAAGRAHAVNYGFAGSGKLLEQVDAVLAANSITGSLEAAPRS